MVKELVKGQHIGQKTITVSRSDLVRYAGASGDFNPIHYSERFAQQVGLPGVIAHGMLTMGLAVDVVSAWCEDPGLIEDYQVRFSQAVVVPEAQGSPEEPTVEISVEATVGLVKEEHVRIDLLTTVNGEKVLAKAQALVRITAGGSEESISGE